MKIYDIKLFFTNEPLVIKLYEDQYNILLEKKDMCDIIELIEMSGHKIILNQQLIPLIVLPKSQKYINKIKTIDGE